MARTLMREDEFDDASGLDPRTGRPWGDHGTGSQAVEYAFSELDGDFDAIEFLRSWREADLEEYPDFYGWLAEQE
jgi:hypothetical protein